MELCKVCHSPLPMLAGGGLRRGVPQRLPRAHPPPFLTIRAPKSMGFMIAAHDCFHRSHVAASLRTGDSARTVSAKPCKILWSIEADIPEGQLYVTGDLVSLGSWDPDMAILFSPPKGNSNLWKAEVKIPSGVHFKYNYFIKGVKQSNSDIVWRPGPEFSLSVPLIRKKGENIIMRDLWVVSPMEALPFSLWTSLLDDLDFSSVHDVGKSPAPSHGKQKKLPSSVRDGLEANRTAIEGSNIVHDAIDDIKPTSDDPGKAICKRDQPVEEPWLFTSKFLSKSDLSLVYEVPYQDEAIDVAPTENACKDSDIRKVLAPCQEGASDITSTENAYKDLDINKDSELSKEKEEKKGLMEENSIIPMKDSVSTVILINSSVCTMQRIAILEDGKLTELLLEPVKNKVQCDSVYLGVVTKLVPHMRGAFVDIGISQPSFMDTKQNWMPFAYPPFNEPADRHRSNGSATATTYIKEHMDDHDPENDLHADDIIDEEGLDDSIEFMHEDFDDPNKEDSTGDSGSHKSNVAIETANFEDVHADQQFSFEENSQTQEVEVAEEFSLERKVSNGIEQLNISSEDTVDDVEGHSDQNKWSHVRKGTKIIVQVVKEGLGGKGPVLSAYPNLRSRFWVLSTKCERIGVSRKIARLERTRLKVIAKTLQPPGFGLTARSVAAGHSMEELQKDLDGLLSTWKSIIERAKAAALAADEGVEHAIPTMLHKAMGQTLFVVQDYFNDKVKGMIVDSPRTYHEVTSYLQEIAPDLCNRVILHSKKIPIFDDYGIEEEIDNILCKRVPLSNGGSLVIEQTEALVSIDVNGGLGVLGEGNTQEKAVLEVNLAAAKQIARELRLRDIGGLIVVDFIDMADEAHKRLVYEEVKKAVERDRSAVYVSELSKHGLMEITRKRVRPSVSFLISEPCSCCHATGRVEALDTTFSKIEREICREIATTDQRTDSGDARSWPKFVLKVDRQMSTYLTLGKRTKLAILSSSLKVWILLKVASSFAQGEFEVKPFSDVRSTDSKQPAIISRLHSADARSYIPNRKLRVFPVKKWKKGGT